ncbi:SDR family NAD(P)-dependent oxidoreductase [Thermodesulfobacteriota bacterium]
MELEGKVALVTGAGDGIGKGIALTFAKEGAEVAVNDLHLDKVQNTAAEISELGRKTLAIKADVSVQKEVNRMVAQVIDEFGGVDILVNNAGGGNRLLLEDMTVDDWHYVLGVNLDGPFFCVKAVLDSMKQRGGGKIINISSLAAKVMSIGCCVGYTTSKSGLLGFTRHLAFEVGPYKINVNAICPGATLTPKIQANSPIHSKMMNSNPLKNMPKPEDIGQTAVFLASRRSDMVTGAAIDVDAGEFVVQQDWEGYTKARKEAFELGQGSLRARLEMVS